MGSHMVGWGVVGWDGESYGGMGSHRVVWGVIWWDGES